MLWKFTQIVSNWRAPPTRTGFPKINSFFAEDEKQITEQRTLMTTTTNPPYYYYLP